MGFDDIGLRIEVHVPDVLQQHGAGDDLPGMQHQHFQQAELAWLQIHQPRAAPHAAIEPVQPQYAHAEQRRLFVERCAAQQRVQPGA